MERAHGRHHADGGPRRARRRRAPAARRRCGSSRAASILIRSPHPLASARTCASARIRHILPWHEQEPRRCLPPERARGVAALGDRRLPRRGEAHRAVGGGARAADLRARRHDEPAADLGPRLRAAGEMFEAAGVVGGLSVQLVYFRGIGESRASPFVANARALRDLMVKIDCRGGHTQIRKVLASRAPRGGEAARGRARLCRRRDGGEPRPACQLAGEIGLLGVRAFMFHEGRDAAAERTFREIARLTGGAYLPFNSASAAELRALLSAVATYAAGGIKALEASEGRGRGASAPASQMRIILPLLLGLAILALLLRHFLKTPAHELVRQIYLLGGAGLMLAARVSCSCASSRLRCRSPWPVLCSSGATGRCGMSGGTGQTSNVRSAGVEMTSTMTAVRWTARACRPLRGRRLRS